MAIGDKIRIKIDSLILGPIKSKQEEIKNNTDVKQAYMGEQLNN